MLKGVPLGGPSSKPCTREVSRVHLCKAPLSQRAEGNQGSLDGREMSKMAQSSGKHPMLHRGPSASVGEAKTWP